MQCKISGLEFNMSNQKDIVILEYLGAGDITKIKTKIREKKQAKILQSAAIYELKSN